VAEEAEADAKVGYSMYFPEDDMRLPARPRNPRPSQTTSTPISQSLNTKPALRPVHDQARITDNPYALSPSPPTSPRVSSSSLPSTLPAPS
jgi:hypothetical protein